MSDRIGEVTSAIENSPGLSICAYVTAGYPGKAAFLDILTSESIVLAVDAGTATHYASVRDELRRQGTPIPENDVWIAALSVLVLAALLSWPASTLVWALSVRRLERKLGQPLSAQERLGQRNRSWFLAIILCMIFSALFNYQILNMSAYEAAHG